MTTLPYGYASPTALPAEELAEKVEDVLRPLRGVRPADAALVLHVALGRVDQEAGTSPSSSPPPSP